MKYQSTRGDKNRVSAVQAIAKGLSDDGGLYVPETFPAISINDIIKLKDEAYNMRASTVLSLFLKDYTIDELTGFTASAYNAENFSHPDITPLHKINENTYFMELWHGPTAAFKDMALQIMPYLLMSALKKLGEKREACIVAATSGDTGKAALEGYSDIPGTNIIVFYPKDGVSAAQKLQMTTQQGENVYVAAVRGNFDDTQNGVKAIFADKAFAAKLDKRGYFLSSANSINWGRLAPQIAYYISTYCELVKNGTVNPGDKINFCVPTGNFGNILAGYYAYKTGLPVGKLICASNRNDVLTQFINTGVYDKNRTFYTTISPSMDILISSNLERLLFDLSGKDGRIVSVYMAALNSQGHYKVPSTVLKQIRQIFASAYCPEEDTLKTISEVWNDYNYLIDTHTAVAYKALRDYRASSGDETVTVVVSTASPFKFSESVLKALGRHVAGNDMQALGILSEYTGIKAPAPLNGLDKKTVRFDAVIDTGEMKNTIIGFLK